MIKQEFLPNTVTAMTRDGERNTFSAHANIRRLRKAINKILHKNELPPLPYSYQEICFQIIYNSPDVSVMEPVI